VLNRTPKNASNVVREAGAAMPRERSCKCGSALAMAILTAREAIPAQTRERLKLIIGKYVGDVDLWLITARKWAHSHVDSCGGFGGFRYAQDRLRRAAEDSRRIGNLLFAGSQLFHQGSSWSPSSVRISTGENENVMKARGIDTSGIERAKGKTFHWGGEYGKNLNEAKTNFTDLNVFQNLVRAFRSSTPTRFPVSGEHRSGVAVAGAPPDAEGQDVGGDP